MSKKKKNKWDISYEEQTETLELFANMKTNPEACNTILGLHDLEDAPVELQENGLPVSLEKMVVADMEKMYKKNNQNNNTNDEVGSDGYDKRPWEEELLKNYPEETDDENISDNVTDKTSKNESFLFVKSNNTDSLAIKTDTRTLNPIYQMIYHDNSYKQYELDGKYIPSLDRVSISDGISQSSLSIKMMHMTTELSTANIDSIYDADYIGRMLAILKEYIISCNHPTAIIPNNEYDEMVSQVTDFDDKHYHFIICDRYVLMYVITDQFHEIFDDIPEKYNMDTDTKFTYYITLASLAGTTHNIFEIDDESYVLHLKEMREPVKQIFIDSFIKTCKTSDEGEKLLNRDNGSMILDASVLQREAREMMMELDDSFDICGDEYDDEDDEESPEDINNTDNNEDDISEGDKPEEKFSDTISFDSLNEDKSNEPTNQSSQSSDDMTINVFRKS